MAETLFDTASGSVLPAVVAKESLREANGRLPAGQIFANNMAGPLLGGMLCASVAALPFPRAATFAAAALTLALRCRFRARPEAREKNTPPTTIKTEIAEGSRGSGGTACRAPSCPP